VNRIMYVLSTGCQWRYVPKDLPAKSTLYEYFDLWTCDGTLENIHHALYVKCREQIGRAASPTACVIDREISALQSQGPALVIDKSDIPLARRPCVAKDRASQSGPV